MSTINIILQGFHRSAICLSTYIVRIRNSAGSAHLCIIDFPFFPVTIWVRVYLHCHVGQVAVYIFFHFILTLIMGRESAINNKAPDISISQWVKMHGQWAQGMLNISTKILQTAIQDFSTVPLHWWVQVSLWAKQRKV